MSHEAFRRKEARIQLQSKLLIAEKQVADGMPLIDHHTVIETLRKKIHGAEELSRIYPSSY